MVASTSRNTGAAWTAATRGLGWLRLGMNCLLGCGGAMFRPAGTGVLPPNRSVIDPVSPGPFAGAASGPQWPRSPFMSQILTTEAVAAQQRLEYWIDMI